VRRDWQFSESSQFIEKTKSNTCESNAAARLFETNVASRLSLFLCTIVQTLTVFLLFSFLLTDPYAGSSPASFLEISLRTRRNSVHRVFNSLSPMRFSKTQRLHLFLRHLTATVFRIPLIRSPSGTSQQYINGGRLAQKQIEGIRITTDDSSRF
jgi:hypothetical protein